MEQPPGRQTPAGSSENRADIEPTPARRRKNGASRGAALKLDFDRRLRLRFRGSVITSDADCWPIGSWTMQSA